MADINNQKISATAYSPVVHYTFTYTKSRPSNSQMTYNFTIKTNLNSSGSFLGTGHTLDATITVNGTSKSFQIKSSSESWRGSDVKSTDTVSVTCSSTSGNATQTVTFKVTNSYGTAGEVTNSSYTVTSSPLLYSKLSNPGNVRVSSTSVYVGDKITLSWTKSSNGTNNTLQKYYIECYYDGAWHGATVNGAGGASAYNPGASATSHTIDVYPRTNTSGTCKYRIRAEGSAGVSYYSDYVESPTVTVNAISIGKPTYYLPERGESSSYTGDHVDAYVNNEIGVRFTNNGGTSFQVQLKISNGTATSSHTGYIDYSSPLTYTTTAPVVELPSRSVFPGSGKLNRLWMQVRPIRNGIYGSWASPSYSFRRSATIRIYNGSTWKKGAVWIYNNGWKPAEAVYIYQGGSWKKEEEGYVHWIY